MNKICELAIKAENNGIYNVASERRGILYLYKDGEYAICTKYGTVRMTETQAQAVAAEFPDIVQDIHDLKLAGVQA